jgi:EF-P beta-lysylation protein EpmB
MPATREILPTSNLPEHSIPPKPTWQQALAAAIRDVPTLLNRLNLPTSACGALPEDPSGFPVLVPESYLARMRSGDPDDPLLRQVLPVQAERETQPDFLTDPVGDHSSRLAPGLLHKYQGRALLIAHGSCAVHCRYCFRRHFPYQQEPRSETDWEPAFALLQADKSIHEVILSGGDPLILSDRRLNLLVRRLADIPHIRRLRIHSRLPIVLPERVTDSLCHLLTHGRLQSIFVVHANHAQELQADCADALGLLRRSGIPVLNQAVLLRNVNDSLQSLAELCERCVDLGVIPYYLHQLDRVQGAAHFEVAQSVGRALIEELRQQLPGYAVPKYVVELAGAPSKVPIL